MEKLKIKQEFMDYIKKWFKQGNSLYWYDLEVIE